MTVKHNKILVVDDDPYVLESLSTLLRAFGFTVKTCDNANSAIQEIQRTPIDVVLTDIKMPGLTGVELLGMIHKFDPQIPVILMTAYAELDVAVDAIKKGAFDFITKPYNADYLLHTIEKAVKYSDLIQMERDYKKNLEETVRKRTQELSDALTMVKNMSREVISRLTVVAEFRDTTTGSHISRIGLYSNKIAEELSMNANFVEQLTFASSMHDLGKIGIPDSILLKPGSLTRDEYELMKTHTTMGEQILSGSDYPAIQLAASVALNHHERFDGGGYPRGPIRRVSLTRRPSTSSPRETTEPDRPISTHRSSVPSRNSVPFSMISMKAIRPDGAGLLLRPLRSIPVSCLPCLY
jgi:putative two-component system response regulator